MYTLIKKERDEGMKNYRGSAEGLRLIFKANIWLIICAFVTMMPLIKIVGLIGTIVASVVLMVGLYKAGEDILACKVAFALEIGNIAVSALDIFIDMPGLLTTLTGLFPIVSNYILLISVTVVLKKIGAVPVMKLGIAAIFFYTLAMVGTVILAVVAVVLAFAGFKGALWLLVVMLVLGITTLVLYLKFLLNSAEALGASV